MRLTRRHRNQQQQNKCSAATIRWKQEHFLLPSNQGASRLGHTRRWSSVTLQYDSVDLRQRRRSSSCRDPDEFGAKLKQELRKSKKWTQSSINVDDFYLHKLNVSSIPLAGRHYELQRIRAAYLGLTNTDNVSHTRLLVIEGPSGCGKTALAKAIVPTLNSMRLCRHCTGKFDLSQRTAPYTAFSAAFTDLIDQILREEEPVVAQLSRTMREALGPDWIALRDVLPNIERLLVESDDPAHAIDPPNEDPMMNARASRLRFFFQKFMICLATIDTPLVLMLDDVQWADPPSLKLLEALVAGAERPAILVIATCRNDEDTGAFREHLEAIRQIDGGAVEEIALGNLSADCLNEVVAAVLRSEPEATGSLACIVHHKTGGNPFFAIQFLQSLVDNDHLTYIIGALRWIWDDERIRCLEVTKNVADLMIQKLMKLDADSQLLLQVASCLGQTFEEHLLLWVSGIVGVGSTNQGGSGGMAARDIIIECLSHVTELGLIAKNGSSYCFAHDQIQTAAFELIPEQERSTLQLQIGRNLIGILETAPTNADAQLRFLAVDLCNCCLALLDDDEKTELAMHNLVASDDAMKKSAFAAALTYATVGLECLGGSERWSKFYVLCLDLSSTAVEAAYCVGDFDTMERLSEDVLGQDGPFEDKVRVYRVRVVSLGARQRFRDAMETGLFVLKNLGVTELSTNPSALTVLLEIMKTKRLIKRYDKKMLLDLPMMDDENRVSAMGIINMMSTTLYVANKKVFLILFLRSVRWTIKYGVNKYSPTAIGTYGNVLAGVFKHPKRGLEYGESAVALSEKLNARDTLSKTITVVYAYLNHWTRDLRASIKPLYYGYQLGMKTGEVESAMLNLVQFHGLQFHTASVPLDALSEDVVKHIGIMAEYKHTAYRTYLRCMLQLYAKLSGKDGQPDQLWGSIVDQAQAKTILLASHDANLEVQLDRYCLQLAYMFGNWEDAKRYSEILVATKLGVGNYTVPRYTFIIGMTEAALCAAATARKNKHFYIAAKIAKQLWKWHAAGNVNMLHLAQLLDAELASVKNLYIKAAEMYREAIRNASKLGFAQDKALAHERAALFYLKVEQDTFWAAHHFDNAIQNYHDWHCMAKVRQLMIAHGTIVLQSKNVSELCKRIAEQYGAEPYGAGMDS